MSSASATKQTAAKLPTQMPTPTLVTQPAATAIVAPTVSLHAKELLARCNEAPQVRAVGNTLVAKNVLLCAKMNEDSPNAVLDLDTGSRSGEADIAYKVFAGSMVFDSLEPELPALISPLLAQEPNRLLCENLLKAMYKGGDFRWKLEDNVCVLTSEHHYAAVTIVGAAWVDQVSIMGVSFVTWLD